MTPDILDLARWTAAVFWAISLVGMALTVGLGLAAPLVMSRRRRRTDTPPVSFVIPIKTFDRGSVKEL